MFWCITIFTAGVLTPLIFIAILSVARSVKETRRHAKSLEMLWNKVNCHITEHNMKEE